MNIFRLHYWYLFVWFAGREAPGNLIICLGCIDIKHWKRLKAASAALAQVTTEQYHQIFSGSFQGTISTLGWQLLRFHICKGLILLHIMIKKNHVHYIFGQFVLFAFIFFFLSQYENILYELTIVFLSSFFAVYLSVYYHPSLLLLQSTWTWLPMKTTNETVPTLWWHSFQ